MRAWDFSLILSGIEADSDDGFDSLWSACADEPLIGTYDGFSEVLFSREAETVEDAVLSAIDDVERINGVRVVGLRDESFWTLGDIAERSGRSPAELRRLIDGAGETAFPQHLSDPAEADPLWRAQDVIDWFREHEGESLTHPAAAVFKALADTLHAHTSCGQLDSEQQRRIVALLGAYSASRRSGRRSTVLMLSNLTVGICITI